MRLFDENNCKVILLSCLNVLACLSWKRQKTQGPSLDAEREGGGAGREGGRESERERVGDRVSCLSQLEAAENRRLGP